jgi:Tfp pilus assembly protein PilF
MPDSSKPKTISQKTLVRMFKDIKQTGTKENRFCFLLGAGASKSSGIKTGWELSEEWYKILQSDLDPVELSNWEKSIGFDESRVGEFYKQLYEKRYEANPQLGYHEFQKIMEHAEPALGYVILSQILTCKNHNFVITTNFDYLIEDALRMYTDKKPLIVGHERLADFVSSITERPTVIKIHRDLLLKPMNTQEETEKLKEEWQRALKPILCNFKLLVIGYGGNDGSLMDYLQNIEQRQPIYWCKRKGDTLNAKIRNLLSSEDFIIEIHSFDQLMIAFHDSLQCKVFDNLDKPDEHRFVKATKCRIEKMNNMLKGLLEDIKKNEILASKETREIFTGAMKFIYDAYLENNIERKENIYLKGINKFPKDADLLGQYATFLHNNKKDYDQAEKYYTLAIEADPKHATNLGNYAIFLKSIRQDYDQADRYYKLAIKADSKHSISLGNYAIFLTDIRQDHDQAEKYFQLAIEADPKDAVGLGNYATFLKNIRQDYDQAEKHYKMAIEADPKHANSLGNFAIFLKNIRQDYDQAEKYYKLAIEADSKHANSLGNYAYFLCDIRQDYDQAEKYYTLAIKADPKHANSLGNYANLLCNIRQDYDQAEKYYTLAIKADPKHANNLGNYASFLCDIRQDYDQAESHFKLAIEADPTKPTILGNYANFLCDIRQDYDQAEKYYKLAIEADPKHANSLGNYANFLYDIRQDYDQAEKYYKLAIEADPDNSQNLGNYALFLQQTKNDYELAEKYFHKAFLADPQSSINLGNYANLLCDTRQEYDQAEKYYKLAIEADSKNANSLGNYAHFLILQKQDFNTAETLIDRAFESPSINDVVLAELWFYRYAHYRKWLNEAEQKLEELTAKGTKSKGWDLQSHVKIAQENEHPDIETLQRFAQLITD